MVALLVLGCPSSPSEEPAEDAGTTPVVVPTEEPVPDTLALRHILLEVGDNRTLDEAMTGIAAIQNRVQDGEDFGVLARELSDDPTGRRGGWLGASTRDAWVPEFSEAAWKLQVGEVSPPVVSAYGVHLIKREALAEVYIKHIVVQHADSGFLRDGDERLSPETARARCEEAQTALADGMPWADAAGRYSNGPMAKRGGDLGLFLMGEFGPTIDRTVGDLEVGETSDIVETPFGFHLLHRYQ